MAFDSSRLCFAQVPPNSSVREKILAAASRVLLSDGFGALTQQAVAAAAAVRQSHVTYYFRTRNDLLCGTAQFCIEAMLAPMIAATAQATMTREQLRKLLTPDEQDRQWFRLMVGLLIACDEDAAIRPWLQAYCRHVESHLTAAFAAAGVAVGTDQLLRLRATFLGLLFHDMHFQSDESFARVIRVATVALDDLLAVCDNAAQSVTINTAFSNNVS